MNKQETFESKRLLLKGINEQDFDYLVKCRSNLDSRITKESYISWYEKSYLNDFSRYDFIIIHKNSGQKIGTVGVNSIDYENSTCEIFYAIAECNFRRKGFASEAVLTIIEKMRMESILTVYAEIHKENLASIKMIQKLGLNKISERENISIFLERFLPL